MKKISLSLIILSAFFSVNAEILVPKVFSDNMVLQREMPVKIWGKADANASVKVEFAGQVKDATACANGNWSVSLEPMKANATNQNMQISENGKVAKEIKDILVGEVWVAGGQSNMVWSVAQTKQLENLGDRANNPELRMFCQEVPLMRSFDPTNDKGDLEAKFDSPEGSKWELTTTQSVGDFGAICFFFAETLQNELKVPVAIIQTPVGGSNMISWLAKEDLVGIKTFEKGQKSLDESIANYDPNKKAPQAKKGGKAQSAGVGFYRKLPSLLYNVKIAPLAGYTARGFIWYQGEADQGNAEFADMYVRVINSWRKYWGDYYELDDGKLEKDNMPFYGIQLASYGRAESWANVRWAQYLVSKKLDDVEVLINIDTGAEKSIHPLDKDIVATRLAKLALGETYDLKAYDDYSFPMIDDVEYMGKNVEVEFDTDSDLKLVGELRGFEVLVGKNWVKADLVELKADKIVLKAENNGDILGVRYLWNNWVKPDACLYNKLDLPAMSFIDLKK